MTIFSALFERHRYALPAVSVALIAALLQVLALGLGPRLGRAGLSAFVPAPTALDYAAEPLLAVPRLAERFVLRAIGVRPASAAPTAFLSRPSAPPRVPEQTPAGPDPSPQPTPTPAPVIPGTGGLEVSMTSDVALAAPGDKVTYTISVTNNGGSAVTTAFVTNTHVPRFTFWCTQGAEACAYPGDYDGASTSSSDVHTFPVQGENTRTVGPHSTVAVRFVVVEVFPSVPSGTALHEHAHVDIIGDGKGAITALAPIVRVA